MDFLQYADGTNNLKQISKFIKRDHLFTKKICDTLTKKGIIDY